MRWLELKLPPLLLVVLAALGMARLPAAPARPPSLQSVAALLLMLAGVAVCVAGVLAFRRDRTTVDPMHPEQASRLVIVGVYRHSRNPMYLGFVIALAGWALWLGSPLAAGVVAGVALYLDRLQIVPEERALQARFGEAFTGYCRQVRRWL